MAGPLDELQRLLGAGKAPGGYAARLDAPPSSGGGLLDLSPDEMAAFMRSDVGSYTGNPYMPRGLNVPPSVPFGFNVDTQTRPFGWNAGVNFQAGPFDVGITAQRGRPHIGGSLMYRRTIPF